MLITMRIFVLQSFLVKSIHSNLVVNVMQMQSVLELHFSSEILYLVIVIYYILRLDGLVDGILETFFE